MPKVPELQQQFAYKAPRVPGARLQGYDVRTDAAMFGGGAGRQMEKAGHMIERGVAQLSYVYDDYNTTKARDAARKMQEGFLTWQSEAQKKVGEEGMATGADYESWAKKQRDELTRGMNDVQRGCFEALAGRQMAAQQSWAEGYGSTQERQYKKTTAEARLSAAADMLVGNIQNPELAQQAFDQTVAESRSLGRLMGLGKEATDELARKQLSKALTPAIHARIQSGDTGTASALIKQYESHLGGTAVAQLGAELQRERKRQAAEYKANQREARLEAAVRETDFMFGQFGSDLGAGYEYIREKYKDDPKTRLELEAAYSRRVSMEDAAEQRTRKRELEQQKNTALDVIGAEDATPQSVSAAILKADPAIQPDLMKAANNRFPSQEVVISDADKLAEAKAGIMTGEYKDVQKFRREFMPHISGREMEKLESEIKRKSDQASDTSLRASFDTRLREYDIEKLASAADMTPAAFVKAAWDNFVTENYEKHIQTAAERRQSMEAYLRRVSLSRPGKVFGGAWPDKEEAPEFAARPLKADGYTEVIPDDNRKAIVGKLEAAGMPATEENIRKVWEYNMGGKK